MFIVCLICWFPYFLAYFPGVVTDDAEWQLRQALGLAAYSNHQPWIHTMMIRGCYNLGYDIWGTKNAGVATYTVIQMCIMAAAFSYLIMILYKEKVCRLFVIGCTLYFALAPFHAIYAITMWKDVLLGAVVMLFSLSLWQLCSKKDMNRSNIILYGITSVLMCMLRNNGFYAYLLCIPFILYFSKNRWKTILPVCVATVALAVFYRGPFLSYLHVVEPDTVESLSIPAQHIARVIYDGGELTDKQEKLLSHIVDIDKIPDVYLTWISDPVKGLVREKANQKYLEDHKKQFLKLWVELGIKHPATYVKAHIDQTLGYWYPDVQYWVTTTMMKENTWGLTRETLLSDKAVQILERLETSYTKIPLLGLLWSIGCYSWLSIIMLGLAVYRKNLILPFLPVLAILATLMIATPVYAEFRYIYSMVTTIPLLIVIGFSMEKKEENTDDIAREVIDYA